jgi:hypothetical protein
MSRFCRDAMHPRKASRAVCRHGEEGLRRAIRPRDLAVVAICVILGSGCLLQAAPKEQPSDELIYDHVIRKLVNDRELKTNQLKVTVEDAIVTVAGEVASEKLRRRVSKVVKGTRGVKKVINEVTVRE